MSEDGRVHVAVGSREHEPPQAVAAVQEPCEALARLEGVQGELLGRGTPPRPRRRPLPDVVLRLELDRLPQELLRRLAQGRVHERAALERVDVDAAVARREVGADGREELLGQVVDADGRAQGRRAHAVRLNSKAQWQLRRQSESESGSQSRCRRSA